MEKPKKDLDWKITFYEIKTNIKFVYQNKMPLAENMVYQYLCSLQKLLVSVGREKIDTNTFTALMMFFKGLRNLVTSYITLEKLITCMVCSIYHVNDMKLQLTQALADSNEFWMDLATEMIKDPHCQKFADSVILEEWSKQIKQFSSMIMSNKVKMLKLTTELCKTNFLNQKRLEIIWSLLLKISGSQDEPIEDSIRLMDSLIMFGDYEQTNLVKVASMLLEMFDCCHPGRTQNVMSILAQILHKSLQKNSDEQCNKNLKVITKSFEIRKQLENRWKNMRILDTQVHIMTMNSNQIMIERFPFFYQNISSLIELFLCKQDEELSKFYSLFLLKNLASNFRNGSRTSEECWELVSSVSKKLEEFIAQPINDKTNKLIFKFKCMFWYEFIAEIIFGIEEIDVDSFSLLPNVVQSLYNSLFNACSNPIEFPEIALSSAKCILYMQKYSRCIKRWAYCDFVEQQKEFASPSQINAFISMLIVTLSTPSNVSLSTEELERIGDLLEIFLKKYIADPSIDLNNYFVIASCLYLNSNYSKSPKIKLKLKQILQIWMNDLFPLYPSADPISTSVLFSFLSQDANELDSELSLQIVEHIEKIFQSIYGKVMKIENAFEWNSLSFLFPFLSKLSYEFFDVHIFVLMDCIISVIGRETIIDHSHEHRNLSVFPEFPTTIQPPSVMRHSRDNWRLYEIQDFDRVDCDVSDLLRFIRTFANGTLGSCTNTSSIKKQALDLFPKMFCQLKSHQMAYVSKLCDTMDKKSDKNVYLFDLCYLCNTLMHYLRDNYIKLDEAVLQHLGKKIFENLTTVPFHLSLHLTMTCCRMLQFMKSGSIPLSYINSFKDSLEKPIQNKSFQTLMLVGFGHSLYYSEKFLTKSTAESNMGYLMKLFKNEERRFYMPALMYSIKLALNSLGHFVSQEYGKSLAFLLLKTMYSLQIESNEFVYVSETLFALVDMYGPELQREKSYQEVLTMIIDGMNLVFSSDITVIQTAAFKCLQSLMLLFPDCARYLIKETPKCVFTMMNFLYSTSNKDSTNFSEFSSNIITILLLLTQRFPGDICLYFEAFVSTSQSNITLEGVLIELYDSEVNPSNKKSFRDMIECVLIFRKEKKIKTLDAYISILLDKESECTIKKVHKSSTKSFTVELIRLMVENTKDELENLKNNDKFLSQFTEILQLIPILLANNNLTLRKETLLLLLNCLKIAKAYKDPDFIVNSVISTLQTKLINALSQVHNNTLSLDIKICIVKICKVFIMCNHIKLEPKNKAQLPSMLVQIMEFHAERLNISSIIDSCEDEELCKLIFTILGSFYEIFLLVHSKRDSEESSTKDTEDVDIDDEISKNFRNFLPYTIQLIRSDAQRALSKSINRVSLHGMRNESFIIKLHRKTSSLALLSFLTYCMNEFNKSSDGKSLSSYVNDAWLNNSEPASDQSSLAIDNNLLRVFILLIFTRTRDNGFSSRFIVQNYIESFKITLQFEESKNILEELSELSVMEMLDFLERCINVFADPKFKSDSFETLVKCIDYFLNACSDKLKAESFQMRIIGFIGSFFKIWSGGIVFSVTEFPTFSIKALRRSLNTRDSLIFSSFSTILPSLADLLPKESSQAQILLLLSLRSFVLYGFMTHSDSSVTNETHERVLLALNGLVKKFSSQSHPSDNFLDIIYSFLHNFLNILSSCESLYDSKDPNCWNFLLDLSYSLFLGLYQPGPTSEEVILDGNLNFLWKIIGTILGKRNAWSYNFVEYLNEKLTRSSLYSSNNPSHNMAVSFLACKNISCCRDVLDEKERDNLVTQVKYILISIHRMICMSESFENNEDATAWNRNLISLILTLLDYDKFDNSTKRALLNLTQYIFSLNQDVFKKIVATENGFKEALMKHHSYQY